MQKYNTSSGYINYQVRIWLHDKFGLSKMIAYLCAMTIPAEVLAAAADLIGMYGSHFSLLGIKDGQDVYCFEFPKNSYTGYPFLYLYASGAVQEVTGEEALEVIASLGAE